VQLVVPLLSPWGLLTSFAPPGNWRGFFTPLVFTNFLKNFGTALLFWKGVGRCMTLDKRGVKVL
jgi:hypothetical protein